jgi:benzoyl-CoA reductase/2-hydroxyglutaryl-CoA dehydratase subunit BcrC/BadD/HgdB
MSSVANSKLREACTMVITIEKALCGSDWLVKLNNYPVSFRNMAEAVAFADRLKARIEAPHLIPVY